MKTILILFSFSIIIISCITNDGILDSGDCKSNRDGYTNHLLHDKLIFLICASLTEQERNDNSHCQNNLFTHLFREPLCDSEPLIPFPWFNKDWDKKGF
ncbi:MAG: hypothetical protein KC550_06435 [Nanoarchaeota archaeon]|nr:hypothetical protein [Nanoarchaeota archaeon]